MRPTFVCQNAPHLEPIRFPAVLNVIQKLAFNYISGFECHGLFKVRRHALESASCPQFQHWKSGTRINFAIRRDVIMPNNIIQIVTGDQRIAESLTSVELRCRV